MSEIYPESRVEDNLISIKIHGGRAYVRASDEARVIENWVDDIPINYPEDVAKCFGDGEWEEEIDGGITDEDYYQMRKWLWENGFPSVAKALKMCGSGIEMKCEGNHRHANHVVCHRMFCRRCGKKNSYSHKRKYSRMWGRIMWAKTLGYVVLTVPERLRSHFKDQTMLDCLYRLGWQAISEIFNVDGSTVVLHLFGDKTDNFHPHINILFPIDGDPWIDSSILAKLRCRWRVLLEELLKVEIGEDEENAWYGYGNSEGKKIHMISYICRSVCPASRFVVLPESLKRFVAGLRRFHNVRWFGELANSKYSGYIKRLKAEGRIGEDWKVKPDPETLNCVVCDGQLRAVRHKIECNEYGHIVFSIPQRFEMDLNNCILVNPLVRAFEKNGIRLSSGIQVGCIRDGLWGIKDYMEGVKYTLRRNAGGDQIDIYTCSEYRSKVNLLNLDNPRDPFIRVSKRLFVDIPTFIVFRRNQERSLSKIQVEVRGILDRRGLSVNLDRFFPREFLDVFEDDETMMKS